MATSHVNAVGIPHDDILSEMTSVSSNKSLTLDLPPSCIQICPTVFDHFVIGTYFLRPKDQADDGNEVDTTDATAPPSTAQKRSGSLIIYKFDSDEL